MGRPLQKIREKELIYIITNPHKLSYAGLGRKLDVDHTTILYWIKKMKTKGVAVKSSNQSEAAKLIDKVLTKLKVEVN